MLGFELNLMNFIDFDCLFVLGVLIVAIFIGGLVCIGGSILGENTSASVFKLKNFSFVLFEALRG